MRVLIHFEELTHVFFQVAYSVAFDEFDSFDRFVSLVLWSGPVVSNLVLGTGGRERGSCGD